MNYDLHIPIYASFLGGGLLLLQNLLMLNVGFYRGGIKKGVGADGDIKLERIVRRHGNLAENAPIFVAVLAIYELLNGQTYFALGVAIAFAASRLMHLVGFSNEAGSHLLRAEGGRLAFLVFRSGGATLSAISSIVLAIGTLLRAAQIP